MGRDNKKDKKKEGVKRVIIKLKILTGIGMHGKHGWYSIHSTPWIVKVCIDNINVNKIVVLLQTIIIYNFIMKGS